MGSTEDNPRTAALAPFLKWAGGKRWLPQRHPDLLPYNYNNYIEPFLGSAAIYFSLRPRTAILADLNADLVSTYQAIRDSWVDVYSKLGVHAQAHSDDYYYKVRSSAPECKVDRAARFLYLNRTCWNGLYRVNRSGIFNVPRGTKNAILLPTDDFEAVSAALKNARIEERDFEETIEYAMAGDFVFVDPPYTVAHNLNGFLKYNDQIFTWADQIRLRDTVERALSRGAKVLVTNADHESIRELYKGVGSMRSLQRATVISGKSSGRKSTSELVVVGNY